MSARVQKKLEKSARRKAEKKERKQRAEMVDAVRRVNQSRLAVFGESRPFRSTSVSMQ